MRERERILYHRKIKAEMVLRGISGAQLAKDVGLSHGHVMQAISGRRYNRKVNEALREHGIPKELLIDKDLECNGTILHAPGTECLHGDTKSHPAQAA